MPHLPEGDLAPMVEQWFENQYGECAVEREVYLTEPRWYADLVVEAGWCTLYVEIENDADSLRPGVAQAGGYAGTDTEGIGMVVTPVDHTEPQRLAALREMGVLVREFDTETGEFVSD